MPLPCVLTSNGTTITFTAAPNFATLTGGQTITLVLDAGTSTMEIVYLTAYTSGATTGTISRAAEDATNWPAHTHASGTGTWACSPTINDFTAAAIGAAPTASPTFTGTPAAPTNATVTDATTQIATDAFVQNALGTISGQPSNFGYIGWTVDPWVAGTGQNAMTAGYVGLVRFRATQTAAAGHMAYYVSTGGASLTSGQNFLGIYDTGQTTPGTATLLGTTADQSTNFATPGLYTPAIVSPPTLTAGQHYFAAVLCNHTGSLVKLQSTAAGTQNTFVNSGLSGLSLRQAYCTTAAQTTLPASFLTAAIGTTASISPYCILVQT